jgi:hypothetical protein
MNIKKLKNQKKIYIKKNKNIKENTQMKNRNIRLGNDFPCTRLQRVSIRIVYSCCCLPHAQHSRNCFHEGWQERRIVDTNKVKYRTSPALSRL